MTIDKNHVVAVNYTLHSIEENGEKTFIEQTTTENPFVFLYGVGMMLPKFEENIQGLAVGDKKSFTLTPNDAYGEKMDNATGQLPIEMFGGNELPPPGVILPLQDQEGNQMNAVVVEVTPEAVIVDFNHPMAGKTLDFDVEVLSTRPATEEELNHGHAHGVDGHEAH